MNPRFLSSPGSYLNRFHWVYSIILNLRSFCYGAQIEFKILSRELNKLSCNRKNIFELLQCGNIPFEHLKASGFFLTKTFTILTISLNQITHVSNQKQTKVDVAKHCIDAVIKNSDYLRAKIDAGLVVYGVNTGFGGSADVRCSDSIVVQESLVKHLNAGKLFYCNLSISNTEHLSCVGMCFFSYWSKI